MIPITSIYRVIDPLFVHLIIFDSICVLPCRYLVATMSSKSNPMYLASSNIWPGQYILPPKDERVTNHATLFCFTLDPIACNIQAFNKMKANGLVMSSAKSPAGIMISNLAVVVPGCAGWSKAPFEGKNLSNSQFLSNINMDEDFGRQLMVHGFDVHSSKKLEYRGDFRSDVCALIRTGCCLKFMVGMHTFNPKFPSMFDENVHMIPAFTMVKVTLKSGNTGGISDGQESLDIKGCFAKISKISIMENTLSSFVTHMKTFPTSLDNQKALTESCRDYSKFYDKENLKHVPLATMLYGNGGDCCMVTEVNANLVCKVFKLEEMDIDEFSIEQTGLKGSIVKLNHVTGESFDGDKIDELDMEEWVVQKYTNCSDLHRACKLMEIAASLKALNIFAVKKYTFNNLPQIKKRLEKFSPFRGVPIVNFQRFLGIFWVNGEMRGLNEFLDVIRKLIPEGESQFKYGEGEDEVVMVYRDGKITVKHMHRFYTVDDVKRRIEVVIDPLIRTEDAEEVPWNKLSLDNQVVHKSVKLPKYCRITVNLSGPVHEEDMEDAENENEDDGIENFINMKMNLSVNAMLSYFGKNRDEQDANRVNLKRKKISEEDVDGGFSD